MNITSLQRAITTAENLVDNLRSLHKSLCEDNPPHVTRMAETHTLELLEEAVRLRDRLRRAAL